MNRYVGNNVVERIPEPDTPVASAPVYFGGGAGGGTAQAPNGPSFQGNPGPQSGQSAGGEGRKPPGPGSGLSGLLSKLGDKISIPELEDIMLIAFMYLLYRETGDVEFLLMGGALLLS